MSEGALITTLELTKLASVTTPGSTPSTMPASNVTHYQPSKVCRFLDLTQAEITVDLTAALAAVAYHGISTYRYLQIIGASITSAGTIEVWTGSSAVAVGSTGTSALHIAAQSYWLTVENNQGRFPVRHTMVDLGSQRSEPFVRVKFSDAANPDTYLDIGTLIIHPGYVPRLELKEKPAIGAAEEPRAVTSVSGAVHTQVRPLFRQHEVSLIAVGSTAQQEVQNEWIALQETVGLHDPIAVMTHLTPTANYMDRFVYGRLVGLQPIKIPELWGASEVRLTIEEMR